MGRLVSSISRLDVLPFSIAYFENPPELETQNKPREELCAW